MRQITLLILMLIFGFELYSQQFSLVNDQNNPIVTSPNIQGIFYGCAWVDIDGDNDLDLFKAGSLFRNIGNGQFEHTNSGITNNPGLVLVNGCSWSDYQNDGDMDLIYSSSTNDNSSITRDTRIFVNNGTGNFSELSSILGATNSASWSVQWSDYNNDGIVDFILTFADGFLSPSSFPNRLFRGNSDGTFTQINSPIDFLNDLNPYTVSNWVDYDEDGDTDLFIASGPANNTLAPDFMYKNEFQETGTATFTKLTASELSFAQTPQDGQQYSFVDYDNDLDLDACLTNWRGKSTEFYKNENGTYASTISPFSSVNTRDLSNAWGDFDNDGDLDVLITSSTQGGSGYYLNQGDGTFIEQGNDFIGSQIFGFTTGITIGDYDNDGDLDFYVVGSNTGLFENTSTNSNGFVNLKLIGTSSNRAALGTRISMTADINGNSVTQKREVSASNTWAGHNSLRVHFGLGDASVIDNITINWPSGVVDSFNNITVSDFYAVTEGSGIGSLSIKDVNQKPQIKIYPVPASELLNIEIDNNLNNPKVYITDLNGKIINGYKIMQVSGSLKIDLSTIESGVYFIKIEYNQNERFSKKIIIR